MQKCYISLIWWQDELEILGVFNSLADAEEFCLTMFEDELYQSFMCMIHQCGYDCDEALDRILEYKGDWYCVKASSLCI